MWKSVVRIWNKKTGSIWRNIFRLRRHWSVRIQHVFSFWKFFPTKWKLFSADLDLLLACNKTSLENIVEAIEKALKTVANVNEAKTSNFQLFERNNKNHETELKFQILQLWICQKLNNPQKLREINLNHLFFRRIFRKNYVKATKITFFTSAKIVSRNFRKNLCEINEIIFFL